eukprot:4694150-Prymnesium_polylepis.2
MLSPKLDSLPAVPLRSPAGMLPTNKPLAHPSRAATLAARPTRTRKRLRCTARQRYTCTSTLLAFPFNSPSPAPLAARRSVHFL